MKETNEQVHNKADETALNVQDLMNKSTTRPSCFSSCPARYQEDCQECHYVIECHTKFNELLFYGPE
jgi:hypothetical protein